MLCLKKKHIRGQLETAERVNPANITILVHNTVFSEKKLNQIHK